MRETLLRGNQRLAIAVAVLALLLSIPVGVMAIENAHWLWRVGSAALLFACLCLFVTALWIFFQPRLAIETNELLVYLKAGKPFRVPLEIVEVFFIGQGAVSGDEPGHPHGYRGAVAANVIVRLADSAIEWHRRDVNLALGVWKDGYISVRGLWCENIDHGVVKKMNHRLAEFKRARTQGLQT